MSTQIQQIRSLIQDKPVPVSESLKFDGQQWIYHLKYAPVYWPTYPSETDQFAAVFTPADQEFEIVNLDTGVGKFSADQTTEPADGTADPWPSPVTYTYYTVLLSDTDIQNIIDMMNSLDPDGAADIRLIAAQCLDAIATNQALVLKVVTMLDVKTDGAALAKSLRDHAKSLRDQVFDPDQQEAYFDFAEQINDMPGWREKVIKDFMRQG